MNQRILEKDKKFIALLKFTNGATIAYAPMSALNATLNTQKGLFNDKLTEASVNITGFKLQKTADKKEMATDFGAIAQTAHTYAVSINDETLQGKTHWTKAMLFNLPDATAHGTCQSIYDALTPLIGIPAFDAYGITLLKLDNAKGKKETFVLSSGAVKVQNKKRNDAKKALLHTNIHDMETTIALMVGLLSNMSTDFQSTFNSLNRTDTTGVHHNILEGSIFKSTDHSGIAGAQIKLVEHPTHIALSDLLFEYKLDEFPSGTSQFEVSATGYHTITITLTIPKGESLHHDFMLDPL